MTETTKQALAQADSGATEAAEIAALGETMKGIAETGGKGPIDGYTLAEVMPDAWGSQAGDYS